jgi:putative proteasome-type protease
MTYAVGFLLDTGLVFASDSRTHAGVDQVSTFSKMAVFERPEDRLLVLLSAGNLAVTQAVVSILNEAIDEEGGRNNLLDAPDMFAAARVVGAALREVHRTDAKYLKEHNAKFHATFIFGGQIRGETPRLFLIYTAGNFIEATADTPYFQIGETKYGKPIIDRVITWNSTLTEAAKCALLSFDATMRSNISVGPPFDLLCYGRDSLKAGRKLLIDGDDAYLTYLHKHWAEGLRGIFDRLHDPDWSF